MAIRVVRLGTERAKHEGLRIGTVRRPPRGVPRVAPSMETMKQAQAAETPEQWKAFVRKYRAEMATPENSHAIALLAALSHYSDFSVGCYCKDESHCHRSILRQLLAAQGARFA